MNPETLQALKASIRHWRANARAECWDDVSIGPGACALCGMYNAGGDKGPCAGCPVAERTGQPHCIGTPYSAAYRALGEWERASLNDDPSRDMARVNYQNEALREVNFLVRLLPEGEAE